MVLRKQHNCKRKTGMCLVLFSLAILEWLVPRPVSRRLSCQCINISNGCPHNKILPEFQNDWCFLLVQHCTKKWSFGRILREKGSFHWTKLGHTSTIHTQTWCLFHVHVYGVAGVKWWGANRPFTRIFFAACVLKGRSSGSPKLRVWVRMATMQNMQFQQAVPMAPWLSSTVATVERWCCLLMTIHVFFSQGPAESVADHHTDLRHRFKEDKRPWVRSRSQWVTWACCGLRRCPSVFSWQNVDPQIWTHRLAPMYFVMYFLMFLKSSTWGLSKGIMLPFLHRTAATLRQWKFCRTNGGATTDAGADAARALRHSSMLMKFMW